MRILFTLLLAASAHALALPRGIYPFRTYGAESGLGNLAAMRLAQDTAGFIWVATQDGVYRFDGASFVRFGLEDGLPSTFIGSLKAAPDGSVWAGTGTGLARFDGRRFVVMTKMAPNAIAIDRSSRVWAAMPLGVMRGDAKSGFARVEGWPAGVEADAIWCTDNVVYAAMHGRLGRYDGSAWTFTDVNTTERIDAVVVDKNGVVWMRSPNHLWSLKDAVADETSALPATSTNGYLAIDRHGNLWVPTDQGIAVHDDSGWRVIGASAGLPTEWARDVLEDREGSFWVASLGVHRMLGRGEFSSHNRRTGMRNDVIWCFAPDKSGQMLVGTDAGLARAEGPPERRPYVGQALSLSPWSVVPGTEKNQIRSVVVRPDGAIWAAGTPAEILRIDNGVRRYAVPGRAVLSLIADHEGAIWASTRNGPLLRKDAKEDVFRTVDVAASEDGYRQVFEDSRQRIWVTSSVGLLCRTNGRWQRFTTQDGLRHDHVSYVMETPSGDLWLAYFEPLGIVRLRPETTRDGVTSIRVVQHLDRASHLTANKVFFLGMDRQHQLWVGTGVGVDVVRPDGVVHYSTADGLAGDDTDAMAFLCDPAGDVFIGTSAGFSHYVARPDPPRYDPPPVRILSASTSAAPRAKRDFAARFAALTFFKDDLVDYQVRLAGLDDEWQTPSGREVHFASLPPGRYRFEVRARLRPGPWSAPAASAFTIEPAWWQTAWARLGAGLLLLAIIALATQLRVALLRRRNRELEALVAQRTRELAAANESLMNLSVTDSLTGMKNRRYLHLCMPEYTSETLRLYDGGRADANADLVFFLIDIDRFKDVNDRHGHLAGDHVLITMHELLRGVMRDSDTLVRWGGEELLLVARNSSRHEAGLIAERIRTAVESCDFATEEGIVIRLTCSVGFAAFPFVPDDRLRFGWEECVDVADICLYAAKHAGRNRWLGVVAHDVRAPETLLERIRRSMPAVVEAGELDVIASPEPDWPRRSAGESRA